MKKQIKQRLTSLATGELVAVVVFWINFFLFKKWITSMNALISISFPLLILSFVLIQGSIFWCILIKRNVIDFIKSKFVGLSEARISGSLYLFDIWLCVQVVSMVSVSDVGNRRVVYTFSTADSFCFFLNDS